MKYRLTNRSKSSSSVVNDLYVIRNVRMKTASVPIDEVLLASITENPYLRNHGL